MKGRLIDFYFSNKVPDGQPSKDPVGRPMVMKSAFEQCTGEAQFLDDTPKFANTLHLYPVISTRPKARIVRVEAQDAERVPGFVGLIASGDIPSGNNNWGVFGDDKIFYDDEARAREREFKLMTRPALCMDTLLPFFFSSPP
jgi:xanthine dehydrogenase/oxidase